MQRLARKMISLKKTPWIRFSRTLITVTDVKDTLHRRVMAKEGHRKVTPVLDEWLKQGHEINPSDLRGVITDLCEFKRFIHALQVSEWFSEGKMFNLMAEDFAARLYLVEIHSGYSEAEKFFKTIPEDMRDDSVYNTLLGCYTKSKQTRHEAEAIYQKMREQSMLSKPHPYYNMISLYGLIGESNMVNEILRQMKENKVEHDNILTANNVLKAYASVPDVDAMEKFLREEEENPRFALAWQTGISMAKAYLKTGSRKKAIEMLHRTEPLVDRKSKESACKVLLEMYRDSGAKLDESRIYKLMYPKKRSVYRNNGGGGSDSIHPIIYYWACGGGGGGGGAAAAADDDNGNEGGSGGTGDTGGGGDNGNEVGSGGTGDTGGGGDIGGSGGGGCGGCGSWD